MKTIQDAVRESMREELSRKGHICLTGHMICSGLSQKEIMEILDQERQRMDEESSMNRMEDLLRIVENLAREARRLEGLGYHGRLLTVLGRLRGYVEKIENNVRSENQKRQSVQEHRTIGSDL